MERKNEIYKVTIVGGSVNVLLTLFKFVAGILGHSAAMIADAVHSLSDFATDIVVLAFVGISNQPKDKSHDYGHGKFETLAATIIGMALAAVAIRIVWNGCTDIAAWLKGGDLPAPAMLALWAALVSILAKELTYQYTIRAARHLKSEALKANAWHHRSDALSSIGTAIGIGGAILLGKRWTVLDPLASVIVGFFILKVAYDLVKEGLGDLMEKSLPDEVEDEILSIIMEEPGVEDPHKLCTRKIGSNYAIEVHIRLDGDTPLRDAHARATSIEKRLKERFGEHTHVNIHVEPVKNGK